MGFVESKSVSSHNEVPSSRVVHVGQTDNANNTHAINMARIAIGSRGVAPNAFCYTSAIEKTGNNSYESVWFFEAVEALVNANISLINCSWGVVTTGAQHIVDKWADHLAAMHSVTMICAAGNNDQSGVVNHNLLSPSKADNVITVGAYSNKTTQETSDDELYDYSCYNFASCYNRKPDFVAPANILGGGTCSATAFTTGVIALMLEARPFIAAYPGIIKAILLSSCHYKVAIPGSSQQQMSSGLTDKQGAGAMNPYLAIATLCRGNYGMRTIPQGVNSVTLNFLQPKYGSTGLNFSVAWIKNSTLSGNHAASSNPVINEGVVPLSSVWIQQNNQTIGNVATSQSTEIVYVSTSATNKKYSAVVSRSDTGHPEISFSYAWSINKERYQYTCLNEGIYLLKNSKTGYYLTTAASTGYDTQQTYTGNYNQMWYIKKTGTTVYSVNSCYNSLGKVSFGDNFTGSTYRKADVVSSGVTNFHLQRCANGAFRITRSYDGDTYAIGIKNKSNSEGARAAWSINATSNLYQQWFLEPVAYQKGDVDLNGSISADDSRQVLRYATSLDTPNTIQSFLADADGDGSISAADASLVLGYAVG